jgi:hypothetical protein
VHHVVAVVVIAPDDALLVGREPLVFGHGVCLSGMRGQRRGPASR